MIFRSKASAYQVLVRPRVEILHPTMGVVTSVTPELTAEFATHNGEYKYTAPDGSEQYAADIRGHYFDSVQQAAEKGWTDEERELVEQIVLQQCQKTPEYVWVHEVPKPVAPWPKYDTTHHNQIPVLADQLGLVAEALAYEQATKKRDSVIEKLNEIQAAASEADALTAA